MTPIGRSLAPFRPRVYTCLVFRYLHTLSAVLFYVLGSTFFLSYILMRNGIAAGASQAWMHAGDMPLLLCGLLYGGTSMYASMRHDASLSKTLVLGITVPAAILFLLLLAVNFWPVSSS